MPFLTGLYIASPVLAPAGGAYNNFVMAGVRRIHFTAAFLFLVNFLWRIYQFWLGKNLPDQVFLSFGEPNGGGIWVDKCRTTSGWKGDACI
ncbi:MAG: hypothetical protein ACUVRY_09680 [Thermoanaerobaculaceae bacterium]